MSVNKHLRGLENSLPPGDNPFLLRERHDRSAFLSYSVMLVTLVKGFLNLLSYKFAKRNLVTGLYQLRPGEGRMNYRSSSKPRSNGKCQERD